MVVLQTNIYDQSVKVLTNYEHNVDVVGGCLGLMEALSITGKPRVFTITQ